MKRLCERSTPLTPESRFARHRAGGSGTSSKVRNFGLGLRPDLFLQLPRVADEYQARTLEASWAEELAEIGFTTRSDGVLRRPKANRIHPLPDIPAEVEELFDQVVFSICARRADIDCEEIAADIARVNVPDASWERIGRFAHIAETAVKPRLGWPQERGFLDTAAAR